MARKYVSTLRAKPVNFLATAPKVNLRSSPAVAEKNVAISADKTWSITGKIGESTGTIEPVPGKKYFWMEIEPSTDLKFYAAATFHFSLPKRLWVRSDVVHWQRAQGVIKRAVKKGGEVVKDVVEPVVDTVTDVTFDVVKRAAPLLIGAAFVYKGFFAPKPWFA